MIEVTREKKKFNKNCFYDFMLRKFKKKKYTKIMFIYTY